MKTIDLLKGLCAECLDLSQCYVYNGGTLTDGFYARLFPLNRDSILDEWFKEDYYYFCRYSMKDEDYCFIPQPALRAKSMAADDEVIDFWILEN